jgi:LysM repeat protein
LNANPRIWNRDRIYPGQQIYIPDGASQPPTPPGAAQATYVVKRGDTLADIAYRFQTTVHALLKANPGIGDPDHIYTGQVINVPGTTPPPAPPPPPTPAPTPEPPASTPEPPASTPEPTAPTPEPSTAITVQIPLIAMNTSGPVGCGDTVVMVTRPVSPTAAPLTAALQQLLSIHTRFYGQSGLYDPLYNSNLTIQSVAINNGVATINLAGTLSLGGECDDPRVAAQFDSIGRQFSTVQTVQVYVNGQPLENLLSGKGA